MVLDAGHIASTLRPNHSWSLTSAQVEFDSPKVLLQNERGLLRALVDESGDKEVLYQMVERS
ncbi:hypothetical protein B0H16DRAFT_1499876 [Mycena metata]|uniref:Uncharacterized protein n=1 Tax=Mycena metata TaxID=1033252 RepID=A0AAD7K9E3_9AGAR|nr:hypothetical protein B0H16DRAFT_1499876 [Mycena metata]